MQEAAVNIQAQRPGAPAGTSIAKEIDGLPSDLLRAYAEILEAPDPNPGLFADIQKVKPFDFLHQASGSAAYKKWIQVREGFGCHYEKALEQVDFVVQVDPAYQGVELFLFSNQWDRTPAAKVPMEPAGNGVFRASLRGSAIKPGLMFGYHPVGHPRKAYPDTVWAVDPHAPVLTEPVWTASQARGCHPVPTPDCYIPSKAVVADLALLEPPAPARSISPGHRKIYELHLEDTRAFPDRMVPEDQSEYRGKQGTFAFLSCPALVGILKRLKVNMIQLMPIQLSDDEWCVFSNPDGRRINVWAYNPVGLSAYQGRYCFAKEPECRLLEIRSAIERLHRQDMRVLFDFVGGHTAERGKPSQNGRLQPSVLGKLNGLRILDEEGYYFQDAEGNDIDFTKCEHAVRGDTPQGKRLILAAQQFFCGMLGFDGMRVDQALVFGLKHDGQFHKESELLKEMVKGPGIIIAEPCDGHRWQCGVFPNEVTEWRPIFEDIAKALVDGKINRRDFAPMMAGYDNIFREEGRVNRALKLTCSHDGKTIWDATADRGLSVEARIRLLRGVAAFKLFTPGPFMYSRGEEVLRSQHGHDNPFDREEYLGVEWFPIEAKEGEAPPEEKLNFRRFVEQCAEVREALGVFDTRAQFDPGELYWYDTDGTQMTIDDWNGHPASFLGAHYIDYSVFVAVWAGTEGSFVLPPVRKNQRWLKMVDSGAGVVCDKQADYGAHDLLKNAYAHRENLYESKQGYGMKMPGIAVFRLVQVPEE